MSDSRPAARPAPAQPPQVPASPAAARLRIAVDARTVYAPPRRGTGKNLIDLYGTLSRLHPSWDFILFHQRDSDDPFVGLPNVRAQRIDMAGDRLNWWQDIRLPFAARAAGADVLHCPANTAPRWTATPTVVTIHDLIPLEMAPDDPETRTWMQRVSRGARRARQVITPSEHTRRLLTDVVGVPRERTTVNYWAPDRACQRVEDPAVLAGLRARYGVPEGVEYVLAFGAEDPRKNTAGILQAWSTLDPALRQRAHLLIVGLQPAALARMQTQVDAKIPDGSCQLHGFVDERDMSGLLSGAAVLCYPSRSEGFGLPVLDAFVCGTPVITSDRTSLPEVAGDAALLVNPDEPRAIADAMTALLTSPDLRERLRAAGDRRVKEFSWERCAQTVAEVLVSASTARP
jgi:glycosyltransferase involved in cell wall biosynthesis